MGECIIPMDLQRDAHGLFKSTLPAFLGNSEENYVMCGRSSPYLRELKIRNFFTVSYVK